jgi:hypothetical protein
MPLISPPPPKGTTTVSNAARSSTISAPMVALPATTSASATGWKKTAFAPSKRRVVSTRHQSSNGSRITVAPSPRSASALVSAAVSGAMMVTGTPSLPAASASPRPKLPALAPRTPPARLAGSADFSALVAARILNEPSGCRFSSLSQTLTPGGVGASSRQSGVRRATPAMLARAVSTSAAVGRRTGVVTAQNSTVWPTPAARAASSR